MKRHGHLFGGLAMGLMAMVIAVAGGGCGSDPSGGGGGGAGGQTLYQKYGAAIPTVVDDAVAGVLADCEIAPYFAVVGQPGHDSVARLKSCLRLQFTVLMGGPGSYPGVNDQGDTAPTWPRVTPASEFPARCSTSS